MTGCINEIWVNLNLVASRSRFEALRTAVQQQQE